VGGRETRERGAGGYCCGFDLAVVGGGTHRKRTDLWRGGVYLLTDERRVSYEGTIGVVERNTQNAPPCSALVPSDPGKYQV
jgi:hypothetical protein